MTRNPHDIFQIVENYYNKKSKNKINNFYKHRIDSERIARNMVKEAPKKSKAKKRNPYYDEAELALSEVLGRKVKITKSSKKGALEIEFFDDADLKKLLKIFDNE